MWTAQNDTASKTASFDTLNSRSKANNFEHDTSQLPLIYLEDSYKVIPSPNPTSITIVDTVFKNPYDKTYPVSYSVVFQNNLVSLFEPGKFVCYNLDNLERNHELEITLNTKKFAYHWILDSQLVAQSGNQHFYFTGNSWKTYTKAMPLQKQPKLFEDDKYVGFFDCQGEFGGTVYFYNKNTQKIYFTEATCPNTIFKREGKYFVLSKLGHGFGSSDLEEIPDPDQLSELKQKESTKPSKKLFHMRGLQTFSSFLIADRRLYLLNWRERTFLAELNDSTYSIVHPLFGDNLYTHHPVTTSYHDYSIINLDFYGIAFDREVSLIIVKDTKITRIDWNEKRNR